MSRLRIPIFFDYASTLCYIAWRIVTPLEDELGFEALWKGVPIATRDFRTKPGRVLGERERQKVLFVAAETGIRVAPPSSWIDSVPALQGSEIARDAGVFRAYHDAVFRAAFDDGADIADAKVLDAIAERAGLDRLKFRAALDSGAMASRLDDHKREADEFSALGLPDLHPWRLSDDRNPARRIDALATRPLHPPARGRTSSVARLARISS